METDQVGSEQTAHDLGAPRQLHEQLDRRKRDVQEETDAQVRPEFAEHRRHKLQLVVLHPDRRALGADLRGGLREAPVHPPIGVPPGALENRRHDHVVVQRPQRGVGKPLVVLGELGCRQRHRVQPQAVVGERFDLDVGDPGPADPRATPGAQERFQRGDQTAGAVLPTLRAVVEAFQIHRQPIRDYDEIRSIGRVALAHR